MNSEWIAISTPPPDGQIVETRCNDEAPIQLVLHRTLWWKPDRSIMAVQIPTHWRPCEVPNFGDFNAVMPLLTVPDNGTIVVAGAYRGDYLLYFSERFPTAKLYGFEPQPEIFKQTCERLGKKATLFNQGLATADRCSVMGSANSDGASVVKVDGQHCDVKMVDAVRAVQSLDPIDLLVLNCEGSEWSLLPYLMDEMMHHRIGSMAVQFHPEYVSGARADRVLSMIDEYYDRIRFDFPHWCLFRRKGI